MTGPFVYPETRLRRHGPAGYGDYDSYRPWLRDEFDFRCVYCLLREQWGRVRRTFDIDHFRPVVQDPSRHNEYENLVYACSACNSAKSAQFVPDPMRALIGSDVRVTEDGAIHAESVEARILIDMMGLDSDEMREFRSLWIGIISLAFQRRRELFDRLMAFPGDLPDLRPLKPPGGNHRPEGIGRSYLVLKESGLLTATY